LVPGHIIYAAEQGGWTRRQPAIQPQSLE